MNYKEIVETITKLLEIQEGVKIHYKIKEIEDEREIRRNIKSK